MEDGYVLQIRMNVYFETVCFYFPSQEMCVAISFSSKVFNFSLQHSLSTMRSAYVVNAFV